MAIISGLQAFIKIRYLMFENKFLHSSRPLLGASCTHISFQKPCPTLTAPDEMVGESIVFDLPKSIFQPGLTGSGQLIYRNPGNLWTHETGQAQSMVLSTESLTLGLGNIDQELYILELL